VCVCVCEGLRVIVSMEENSGEAAPSRRKPVDGLYGDEILVRDRGLRWRGNEISSKKK